MRRDAGAVVGDGHPHLAVPLPGRDVDLAARPRVLDRVVDVVGQHLVQATGIGLGLRCHAAHLDADALRRRERQEGADHRLDGLVEAHAAAQQLEAALVDLGEREQVVDRAAHVVDLLARALQHLAGAAARDRARAGSRRARCASRPAACAARARRLRPAGASPRPRAARRSSIALRVTASLPISSAVRGTAMRSSRRSMPISAACDGHPLDRPQRLAGQPPAAQRGRRQRRRAGQQEQREHPIDGLLDLLQRLGDDEHLAPAVALYGGDQREVVLVPAGPEVARRAGASRRPAPPPARRRRPSAARRPAARTRSSTRPLGLMICAAERPGGSTVRLTSTKSSGPSSS